MLYKSEPETLAVNIYFNSAGDSMSKLRQTIFAAAPVFWLILQLFGNSQAQTIAAKIKISENSPSVVNVEGKFLDVKRTQRGRNLSFLQTYAGAENLGARISEVVLSDRNNQLIHAKQLQAGEFLAENDFVNWSYQSNAVLPENSPSAAHVSNVAGASGILMLDDLLPQFGEKTSAKISFELPKDWQILTTENKTGENIYETADLEKAIFYVGKNLRSREIPLDGAKLNLIISGENQFSDDEAAKLTGEIFNFYVKLFGSSPREKFNIFLGKFAAGQNFGRWEAETRGANVTIFSAGMAFKNQSVQLLHEQLRHEIFHFWMPNNLNLSGSYDWFYEGFAVYQALRIGVAVNRIRFEDFLDTLARAHSIDNFQTRRISLTAAAENRWNGANTQIYARGMLVAFLCDIAVLRKSKGKQSLDQILRQIYETHRFPNPRTDGSEAILKILQSREELRPIIEKYVTGAENIDWQNDLSAVGIDAADNDFSTKLKIKTKLNGREKDLLDKLGYNNWRKLTSDSK